MNEFNDGENLNFYWNSHAIGAARDGAIPICKKTEAPLPGRWFLLCCCKYHLPF